MTTSKEPNTQNRPSPEELEVARRQRLAEAWLNALQAYRDSMELEKLRRRYPVPLDQPLADGPSAGPKTMAQLTADAERDTRQLIQLGMLVAASEPSQMSPSWEKQLVDAIVKVAEDQKLAWFIMMLRRAKDLLLQFAPATPPSLAASAADEEFVQVISAFFVFDGQATARPK